MHQLCHLGFVLKNHAILIVTDQNVEFVNQCHPIVSSNKISHTTFPCNKPQCMALNRTDDKICSVNVSQIDQSI